MLNVIVLFSYQSFIRRIAFIFTCNCVIKSSVIIKLIFSQYTVKIVFFIRIVGMSSRSQKIDTDIYGTLNEKDPTLDRTWASLRTLRVGAGSLPLFLSQAKTWRAAAQPQKGRSASGALVTAVSKSVHACLRASESVATPGAAWRVAARVLAHFGGSTFRDRQKSRPPSKVARRYRSWSRTRAEREKGWKRERESLERTCCARTSTSLQRASLASALKHVPPEPRFFLIVDTRRRMRTRCNSVCIYTCDSEMLWFIANAYIVRFAAVRKPHGGTRSIISLIFCVKKLVKYSR